MLPRNQRIELAEDFVIAQSKTRKNIHLITKKQKNLCHKNEEIFDIGPKTIQKWAQKIKKAKTVVWVGPLGDIDHKPFAHSSLALAKIIASQASGRAIGIAGGGETLAAIEQTNMEKYFDYLSTAGGALLYFLAGKQLPAIEAFKN